MDCKDCKKERLYKNHHHQDVDGQHGAAIAIKKAMID